MSNPRPRHLAALILMAFATALAMPSPGHAATIKACQNKKNGKLRIAKKCKKNEKRVTWNTKGPKGDNGANGANGTNGTSGAAGTNGTPGAPGANGQPQSVQQFDVKQDATFSATDRIDVGTYDGIKYRFQCASIAIIDVARLYADAPSGEAFSQAALARPAGIDRKPTDPWSSISSTTLGGGEKVIASVTTLDESEGSVEQDGVFTTVVQGPTSTTYFNFRMVSASTCSMKGVAFTVPNAS